MRILAPYIRELCHELIEQMLAEGPPAEFVDTLAHPLPSRIIFRLIGFPEAMMRN